MIRRAAWIVASLAVVAGGFFAGRELVRSPSPQPILQPAAPAPSAPPLVAADPTSAALPAVEPAASAAAGDRAPVERLTRRERRQRLGEGDRFARRRQARERRAGELEGRRPRSAEGPRFGAGAAESAGRGDRSMALDEAIREHASGPWVEGRGTVMRVLRDDLRGRQHQRFVLQLASGGTLLVAHNTQLAGRAPVEEGEEVRFRGRYEWGARGGVVHWTHRDPGGGSGGWLEIAGRRYE